MGQDITIAGASFVGVPAIDVPKTGGGDARFHDRTIPLDWMGIEPEFVKKLYEKEYLLKDTDYPNWTPSGTAAAIVASETLTDKYAADMTAYEYLLRWRFEAVIEYLSGVTNKAIVLREIQQIVQTICKRPSSYANIGSETFDGNACFTAFTVPWMRYYNSSGTLTYTWAASYGLYSAAVAATFSNSTSNAPNITIKTPSISARCSNTYFATTRAPYVDQDNTKLKLLGELYRVKKGTFVRACYGDVVDMINNSMIF